MAFVLRAARPDDARELARHALGASSGVAEIGWAELVTGSESVLDVGERLFRQTGVAGSFENCIVATADDRVVGMIHAYERPPLREVPEQPVLRPFAELRVPGTYYLACASVLESHRGLGIGSKLIDNRRDAAGRWGYGRLSALVFADNHGSLRLLGRHGFNVVDSRPVPSHPALRHHGDILLLVASICQESGSSRDAPGRT